MYGAGVTGVLLVVGCLSGLLEASVAAGEGHAKRMGGVVTVDDFVERVYDDGQGHQLPYRLFIPRGGAGSGGKQAGVMAPARHPLVLFLHGAGGRGTDNRGQITDQDASLVFVKAENQAQWPVFMVAPQCPPDQQWVDMPWGAPTGKSKQPSKETWPLAAAIALVNSLRAQYPGIDPHRLYVTGMSMGGYGTWDAAVRHPDLWKAAVIVCGGYDELTIAPLIRVRLPIWAFHAADDEAVPVNRSREMIAALRAAGGTPRYTEYPASAHYGHFSWRPAYAEPDLLPWMFGRPPAAARSSSR
ncbi:MAG: prolyl oligopeptidase family serine peptidase [Polyangia bacterium]